jgi:hypothetical protein
MIVGDVRLKDFDYLVQKMYGNGEDLEQNNSKWNRFKYTPNSGDPVSCSKFFHATIQAIIKNIFGYQEESKSYVPSILGTVQGHYAVIEEQQRKTLHVHMLVFVKEFSDYQAFHRNMATSEEYNKQVIEYMDRIMCEVYSESEYTDLLRAKAPFFHLCPPLNAQTDWKSILNYEHQIVQRLTQHHACQNHCLKRNGKCRYSFPKFGVEKTHYDQDNHILKLKRNDSWINTNQPIITAVTRSNNDIQFLPGKGDPRISR